MKKQLGLGIFLTILLSLSSSNSVNAFDIKKYQELKQISKEILKLYIHGVGEGYSWSNSLLILRGDKPFYCPPSKIVLNPDNYMGIIERQLAKSSKLNVPLGKIMETPVELMLYVGLVDSFPCLR